MTGDLDQEKLLTLLQEGLVGVTSLVSEKVLGEKPVFDIEVSASDGLFSLNGLVVHNCKESLLSRSYSEMFIREESGSLRLTHKGETREFPAKTRVAFFDTKARTVVYGPLQVAVYHNFPISEHTLDRLFSDYLKRLSAD